MNLASTITPVFVYGTLNSPRLLAWVLTGDFNNTAAVLERWKPAVLHGYSVRRVLHADYPALVEEPSKPDSQVSGFLIYPRSETERIKLDEFDEIYGRKRVSVIEAGGGVVEADVSIWDKGEDMLQGPDNPWSFEEFQRDKLDAWIDMLAAMDAPEDIQDSESTAG